MSRLEPLGSVEAAASHVADCRVIRQCLEALLFEGLLPYQVGQHALTCELAGHQFRLSGRVGAFGRVRLNTLVNWSQVDSCCGQGQTGWPDLADILREVAVAPELADQLYRELLQTQSFWRQANEASRQPSVGRRHLSYRELEQALIEGHPYHPCFKVREGFSACDNLHYGPEYGGVFALRWVAIRRGLYRTAMADSESIFWIKTLGEAGWLQLQQRLYAQQGSWDEYGLLPLHPWQWQQLASNVLNPALAQRELLDLGECGAYQPTASIRTLWHAQNVQQATIKLPLDIVVTSSRRNLEPASLLAAPLLSKWLQTLLDNDPFMLQRGFAIQAEYAGICLTSDTASTGAPPWLSHCQFKLSALFRDSVESQLQSAERAIPLAALLMVEEDGRPWLDPLLQQHGISYWLDCLIGCLVLPVWHLLVHHGIGIEAHAQNLVLVLQDGLPRRIIAKDFHESLEYVPDFLAQPQLCPDFASIHPHLRDAKVNDSYWMSDTEALRELFIDTVFIYNLSELSWLLQEHYGFCETVFWARVWEQLSTYNRSGVTAPDRIARIDLQTAEISTESLLTRKLRRGQQEYRHTTRNPFFNLPDHPLPRECG